MSGAEEMEAEAEVDEAEVEAAEEEDEEDEDEDEAPQHSRSRSRSRNQAVAPVLWDWRRFSPRARRRSTSVLSCRYRIGCCGHVHQGTARPRPLPNSRCRVGWLSMLLWKSHGTPGRTTQAARKGNGAVCCC